MEESRENRKEQSERELLSKLSQEQKIVKNRNAGVLKDISEIDSQDNSEERRYQVSSEIIIIAMVVPNGTADPVVFVSQ